MDPAAYTSAMTKQPLKIPAEFDNASTQERIEFVGRLWDEILKSGEEVPVPDHHKTILGERLHAYRAVSSPGKPWPQVRDELLARFGPR